MGSEATAAAVGQAAIRRDPMAMLPFCGYNMAKYWRHWIDMGFKITNPPGIFRVNWFRKDETGKFVWPGFGENMRVLEWIVGRVKNKATGVESPFGTMPTRGDLNWQGLDFDENSFHSIMDIAKANGLAETNEIGDYFKQFGDALPSELEAERQKLIGRLEATPEVWKIEDAA